jgi:hypothetical protein
MAIEFPALKPSSYSFTPAIYNVTAPKFLNSTLSPRLNSSKPNAAVLTLNYPNISAAKILSIFSAWDSSYSGFFPLKLPPEVVAGIKSTDFAGRVVGPKSTGWRFLSEPKLNNLIVGVGSVSVELKGEFYQIDNSSTGLLNKPALLTSRSLILAKIPHEGVFVDNPTPSTMVFTSSDPNLRYVPVPNSITNTRAMQLNNSGSAMNTGATPNLRNCIYTGLVCNASSVSWQPVGQEVAGNINESFVPDNNPIAANAINSQRFDYYFGIGNSTGNNTIIWTNTLNLIFGAFYLVGPYPICGPANTVSLLNVSNTGSAQSIATSPSGLTGSQNSINSSTYNITFGASGITGTLQFYASTITQQSPYYSLNSGTITITVNI